MLKTLFWWAGLGVWDSVFDSRITGELGWLPLTGSLKSLPRWWCLALGEVGTSAVCVQVSWMELGHWAWQASQCFPILLHSQGILLHPTKRKKAPFGCILSFYHVFQSQVNRLFVPLAFSLQLDVTLRAATVTVLLLFSSDSGPVFSLLLCSGANRKPVFNMLGKFSFA